ncbi:nucleotidyltransferase domain-containing protein [archaeon]|nr:nucleotidyltransferase domain-containing protein [archaeon]
MERNKNLKVAKAFAKRVKKAFGDAKIIFFGSRAGKDYLLESDYDFIIISKSFQGINFFKRMSEMYAYWNERQALEALCYTPEEFEEKKKLIGIASEAAKKGITLS